MAFLDQLKRRLGTPGFAGGTLEDQILRAASETGDVNAPNRGGVPLGQPAPTPERGGFVRPPTMADRAMERVAEPPPATMTVPSDIRQRNVTPPASMMQPDAERVRAITDPRTGRPNEDFYRGQSDTQGLFNAYQNWQPRGAKRGFKNSLKSAAMMAAEAVRNNPDDPVTAALAGFGIGAAGGTAVPNFKNRLLREWKRKQVGGELQQELGLKKEQALIDQGTMVPVQLDNGETVMVPQRTAGSLRSQQQGIRQKADTLAERKRVNTDRKNRWDAMDKRDRTRNITALYNSGGLNDPELLEYAADQLGLPGPLREKFIQGKLQGGIDAEGNLININRQTGEATPITAAPPPVRAEGQPAPAPVKGFQVTQETGRNTRAANRETRLSQPKAEKVKPLDPATKRQIAEGIGAVEKHKRDLAAVDEEIKNTPQTIVDDYVSSDGKKSATYGKPITNPALKRLGTKRRELVDEGAGIAATLNALDPSNETGSGTGGYIYRKSRAPSDLDQPIYGKPTTPATQSTRRRGFSISAYKQRNKGATDADARAYAKQHFPDNPVVP